MAPYAIWNQRQGHLLKVHKGETIAGGIALGPVWLQGYDESEGFAPRIPSDQVESELNRLRDALKQSRAQIEELKQKHEGQLGSSEIAIFDTHVAYLQDPMFIDEIEKLVIAERLSVRASIKKVVGDYDRIFQLVENDYLRQRASDFRDVATRVLRNLDDGPKSEIPRPKGPYILAARRLGTTDMFSLDNEQVEGIVAEEGGISSHAAILARSMGIPTITGIRDLPAKVENGDFVILDASAGELSVNPDERLRAEYEQSAQRYRQAQVHVQAESKKHTTRDGQEVRLLASCGNVGEVNLARTFGMDGIGLFRTELLFLVEKRIPSEDMLVHEISADGILRMSDITPRFIRILKQFAPFGPGNMRPVFFASGVEVFGEPRIVGRDHLKLKVRQDGVVFDAIGFNLGSLMQRISGSGSVVDLLFTIEENTWNGNVFPQLKLRDLRAANDPRTRQEVLDNLHPAYTHSLSNN